MSTEPPLITECERNILILRLGFDTGEGRPIEDVAARLGLTTERAREIEASGLSKMQHRNGDNPARDLPLQ